MCSLSELSLYAEKTSLLDNFWQLRKRIPRFIKNRLYLIKFKVKMKVSNNQEIGILENKLNLHPGDRVRIKSRKNILSTLDGWKTLEGCRFMDEMWEYCGKEYVVLKKVNHILDERDMKLKKCKNMVLLDALFCNGSWPFKECDRSCYYIWKEAWLERAN